MSTKKAKTTADGEPVEVLGGDAEVPGELPARDYSREDLIAALRAIKETCEGFDDTTDRDTQTDARDHAMFRVGMVLGRVTVILDDIDFAADA